MSLSAKEEAYCQAYIVKLDKAKAAVAAGYSKKSARFIGYENHTKPHILARIAELREEMKERLGIDTHSILSELAALAYSNVKDFIVKDNKVKDLSKLSRAKLRAVASIKTTETRVTMGEVTTVTVNTDFKLSDKRAALVDLGRHTGAFEKDNLQKAIKIKVSRK